MIDPSRQQSLESYLETTSIPPFLYVEQEFADTRLDDVPAKVASEFRRSAVGERISPGQRIAICVGSRGIHNLEVIVRQTVQEVRARGATPYIIPAMGSHGNANAAGQEHLLSEYGITGERVGATVVSSMDVIEIGRAGDGTPVYADKHAAGMDGIILVNRVKPHPSFSGPFESGLIKMAVIGMGKHKGAEACHKLGFGNFAPRLLEMCSLVFEATPVLFGIAILENAYDETLDVRIVPKSEIISEEPKLLAMAREHMPRILPKALDVLIIDQVGKNISGSGADPNVTGKFLSEHKQTDRVPPTRIVMLDLSLETEGSAVGMGIADFVTGRFFEKLDAEKSYINGITSTLTSTCRLPIVVRNDYYAIKGAIRTCNAIDLTRPRIARIHDTLSLDRIMVSEALLDEVEQHPQMRVASPPAPLRFNEAGDLVDAVFG